VDRSAEVDVLTACEVGMEAGAQLEQRADTPLHGEPPARGTVHPGGQAQQGGLPRPVATHETDGLARVYAERDILQRLDHNRAQMTPADNRLLQRHIPLRVHLEATADALGDDGAGFHHPRVLRTSSATARTKTGSSFKDSIRSSPTPSCAALSRASTSMSQRISR